MRKEVAASADDGIIGTRVGRGGGPRGSSLCKGFLRVSSRRPALDGLNYRYFDARWRALLRARASANDKGGMESRRRGIG